MIRIILLSLLLTGCSFIESDAGKARYRYTVTDESGTRHEIDLFNAKDVGLVGATVTRLADGSLEIELIEQGISASAPMSTMAESNGKLVDALLSKVP